MSGHSSTSKDAKPVSLDFNEDITFQERTWAAQRIGWWAMALFLAAALAGLFATGPLSQAMTTDPAGALRVEYEHFQRNMAPSAMWVHVGSAAPSEDAIAIRVNDKLAAAIKVEAITPEPEHARVTSAGIEYTFAAAEPKKAAPIRFDFTSNGFGPIQDEIGLADREPARFTIFIHP